MELSKPMREGVAFGLQCDESRPETVTPTDIMTFTSLFDAISLRCHYEIVAVKATNLVCPPVDGDSAPLCQQCRMVAFALGELPDFVGELECSGKIGKLERAFQPPDSVPFDDLPIWNLQAPERHFIIGRERRILAAGFAFHLLKFGHDRSG